MKLHHMIAVGSIAGLSLLSAQALAQARPDAGFYLGGSIGMSETDIDSGPLAAAGFTVITTDDKATGWKVFGGYQFHRNWAVELGYVDLGNFSVTGTVAGAPAAANVDITGWSAALVGILPLGDAFGLFGKIGAFHSRQKAGATVGAAAAVLDDRNTNWTAGIGATWSFTRNFAVRAEAEHFRIDRSDSVNLFSVGLQVKF